MVDSRNKLSIPSMPLKKKGKIVETRTYYEDDSFIIVFSKISGIKKLEKNVIEVITDNANFRFTNVKRIERFMYEYLSYLNDSRVKRTCYDN